MAGPLSPARASSLRPAADNARRRAAGAWHRRHRDADASCRELQHGHGGGSLTPSPNSP